MKRKASVILALLLISSMLLTSCNGGVPQEDYDAMKAERDAMMAERDARVAELNNAQGEIADLQDERDSTLVEMDNLQSERDMTLAEITDLKSEQRTALSKIADLQAERDTALGEADSLQVEMDNLMTEKNTILAEIANLEAEINDLQEQVGTTATSVLAEEAWDTAVERYTTLRESIDFDLEGLTPWIKLPEKPAWLDSVRMCSAVLVDKRDEFEAVCLLTLPDQQLLMSLSEYEEVKTVVCRGGSQEYLTTITRDEDGNIIEVTMLAGESSSTLSWTEVGGDKLFKASVDGEIYEAPWSDDPVEFENFCSDIVNWLGTIDKTGGLIPVSDQPMMLLSLGLLSNRSGIVFTMTWLEIAQRLITDFMEGVPASCY